MKFPRNRIGIIVVIVGLSALVTVALSNLEAATFGRIAYWHLDEANGPKYADSAESHSATCTTCPTAILTGQIGTAQQFAAVSGTHLTVAADPDFDWSNNADFSIELWMKPTEGVTCAAGDEVFIGRNSGNNPSWSLGCSAGSGVARFVLRDSNGASVTLSSSRAITTPVWHHLTATRDGSSGITTLIVDGSDVVSSTQAFSGSFSAPAAPITIGSYDSNNHFSGLLDEIAISNVVQTNRDAATHYYLSRAYDETCVSAVDIMPLGDSITEGRSSGVTDQDKWVAFRKDLWHGLTGEDYFINFVGTGYDGWFYETTEGFDANNQGSPGASDGTIAANLPTWLALNPPDVILLHIGTNALNDDPADVEAILNIVDAYDERIPVILARIINRNPPIPLTTTYNDNVEAMVLPRIAAGDKIIRVDMESEAGLIYATQPAGDMWDTLHPFATGYSKMATQWQNKLDTFMPGCVPAALAPRIEASNGSDARLDWTAINGALTYDVFRGVNDPYFTPTTLFATVTTNGFTDTLALSDPANNYFYAVKTGFFSGDSAESKHIGAFTFELYPGQ